MTSIFSRSGILLLLLSLTACVQFKTASLYDGVEPAPVMLKPETIDKVVESRIYDEDPTDVWGIEKNACQNMSYSDVAHSGSTSLALEWNRNNPGCKWSGIGIGWDRYAGKDLTEILPHAAIQMYVRTQEGRSFGLPFVLTLEDYSGGMGFCYTSNKYFERTAIDEEWQRVLVPLADFEMEKENLDPSNIKQLQIELQQSGKVYLDDISLVFYTPEPQTPWMEEAARPSPLAFPITLFDEGFINDNGWGMIRDKCQNFLIKKTDASSGRKAILLEWDSEGKDCSLMDFGVSWNRWFPVDLSGVRDNAAIQFDVRRTAGSSTSLPIQVGFEDYDRIKVFAPLNAEMVEGGRYTTDWQTVRVPLSAIPDDRLDFKRIKQLYIRVDDKGAVMMDNIRMVD